MPGGRWIVPRKNFSVVGGVAGTDLFIPASAPDIMGCWSRLFEGQVDRSTSAQIGVEGFTVLGLAASMDGAPENLIAPQLYLRSAGRG